MIPKIIHQIGPEDRSKWHPIWVSCYNSWKNIFQDYEFIFWNDSEDLDNFIKEKYPEKFNFYNQLPFHMMKMDFSRYAILNYFGGTYADLDVYCYENFYEELNAQICLIEPIIFPDNNEGELIMGCLMSSEPNQVFWKDCMETCENLSYQINLDDDNILNNFSEILKVSGPKLLFDTYQNYQDKTNIQLLPQNLYHPPTTDYFDGMKTKHMKTLTWGKEAISLYEKVFSNLGLDYKSGMKKMFSDIRGIDVDDFNFKNHYN